MKFTDTSSRNTLSKRARLVVGIAMLSVGLVMAAGVGLYYGLGRYGAAQLEDLNASVSGPVAMPGVEAGQPQIHGALMPDGSFRPIRVVTDDLKSYTGDDSSAQNLPVTNAPAPVRATYARRVEPAATATPPVEPTVAPAPDPEPAAAAPIDGADLVYTYNTIYPGYRMHPKYWGRAWDAGADEYAYGAVKRPDGFVSVASSQGAPRGGAPVASRIRIPSINIESEVKTLAVIDIGDSRQYETPKHVVGRIPNTSNPGELGNGWLFGHLESPIMGEGNVFQRLPEIPALLNTGDPVYVSILNEDGDEFLYQITATNVVHQDDLALYDTDDSTITLVACVPRLVYDHRLLVTGKLVGVKRAA